LRNRSYFTFVSIVLAGVVGVTPAAAQIANVQSLITKEKPGWSLQFDGSFDFRSWNSQQTVVGGSAIGRYVHESHLVLLLARGDVVKAQTADARIRHLEHARYRYTFTQNALELEAFAQHSTDTFRRLDNRVLLGAGPRVRLLSGAPLSIALGLTPMFEFERIGDGNKSDAGLTRTRGRLSTYVVMGTTIGERLLLRHSIYLQPRFDDWNDTRVLNEFEGTVRINKTFALKWTVVGMQDPRAPKGIVPIDTTVKSSFVVTL
jgi:putative salt-induced outer membrane protein YdiY